MALLAVLVAAASSGSATATATAASTCLGEYVEDDATGECVLAANGGDVDEPTASHPSCAAHEFLCPDRATC
eukprot:COSAG04_NODE_16914_length_485_cov_0.937824_1_plen_71_part_01